MDEANFRRLISGERRGASAAFLRGGLSFLSMFYGCGIAVRNFLFDVGWKRAFHAKMPVVSVGNITTGGTGKTPIVAYLANRLKELGMQPYILSRGYRSLDDSANDEKLVLDALCPGIVHLQNPDRVAAANQVSEQHDCNVLILDDGFQHRRLARNLNIVLIDALDPWGDDRLLPRGLLREPVASLKRSDLIIVTRSDQCSAEARQSIDDRLEQLGLNDRVLDARFWPRRLINVRGESVEIATLGGARVAAFCGIGNPEAFWQTLADAGMTIAIRRPFPDHHHYSTEDLEELAQLICHEDVSAVVTTQKDLVKLSQSELAGHPLWAIEISAEFMGDDQLLIDALESCRKVK